MTLQSTSHYNFYQTIQMTHYSNFKINELSETNAYEESK